MHLQSRRETGEGREAELESDAWQATWREVQSGIKRAVHACVFGERWLSMVTGCELGDSHAGERRRGMAPFADMKASLRHAEHSRATRKT